MATDPNRNARSDDLAWRADIERLSQIVAALQASQAESGPLADDPTAIEALVASSRGEAIEVTDKHVRALIALGVLAPVRHRRLRGVLRRTAVGVRDLRPGARALRLLAVGLAATSACGVGAFWLARTPPRNDVHGVAFVDYEGDGEISDATVPGGRSDRGVPGVSVTLFGGDDRPIGTARTAADGAYSIRAPGRGPFRVEFTRLPPRYFPTLGTGDGGRSQWPVQFVARGERADLAIVTPEQYCQTGPLLATTCFVSGDHSVDRGKDAPGARDAVVSFPWEATDFEGSFPPEGWPAASEVPASSWTRSTGPKPGPLASVRDFGAVWGLAFERARGRLFAAAMVKRHADLGQLGTGGLYVVDDAAGPQPVARPWLDLATLTYPEEMASPLAGGPIRTGPDPRSGTTGNEELPPRVDLPSHDVAAFSAVGTVALGDIEIDGSGATLWIVNLHDRTLLAVDTRRRSIRDAWEIPDPGCRVPDDRRPWGLAVEGGEVFVGIVCSAQASQRASDLSAHVMRFDGTRFARLLSMPLDYPRRAPASRAGAETNAPWMPWTPDTRPDEDPQPVLSDIAFDEDAGMILAFADRQGHQWGHVNYPPAPNETQLVTSRATAGEILRACRVGGSWELERNGRCGGRGTGPQDVGTGPGAGAGDTRGSAEFYFGEGFRSPFVDHQEAALGSVATLPGSAVAAANIFDPTGLFTSGTVWLSAETGDHSHRYEVLTTETPEARTQNGTFGKASGLGDLEVLCAPAPLGIGGRLWIDRDGDGIHDPTETPPEPGVDVHLWRSGGPKLATVQTSRDGSYAFGRAERLEPDVDYEVRVPLGQGPLRGHVLSPAKAANGPGADLRDSDGRRVGRAAPHASIPASMVATHGSSRFAVSFGFVPGES